MKCRTFKGFKVKYKVLRRWWGKLAKNGRSFGWQAVVGNKKTDKILTKTTWHSKIMLYTWIIRIFMLF